MLEKIPFEQSGQIPYKNRKEIFDDIEKKPAPEEIENLPDWEEPGSYYRGVKAKDALKAVFGELKLDANPENDIIGSRDNASLNIQEAIYFSPSSQTAKGKKFLCAIGFDPLPIAKVEDSYLKRSTFVRITGPVIAKEIILRFTGNKPGQPSKEIKYFSPKKFYQWYKKNIK